jgi:hypothetical protein
MLMLYDNDATRAAFFGPGSEPLGAEVRALVDELRESGELVATDPLTHPVRTKTVRPGGGAPVVTDGPLAEAKEHLGGYLILDCETPERALEIAVRWPSSRFALELSGESGGAAEAYALAARLTTSLPERRYLEQRAQAASRVTR